MVAPNKRPSYASALGAFTGTMNSHYSSGSCLPDPTVCLVVSEDLVESSLGSVIPYTAECHEDPF